MSADAFRIKTGAGVLPFAARHGVTCFLFHRTFSGRRAGCLVDFGGSSRAGETLQQTAAREFVEETGAMFFSDVENGRMSASRQREYMASLIETAQREHPHWYCRRRSTRAERPRNWKTFFVEVDYTSPDAMNRAWREDTSARLGKRRELLWVPAGHLLDIIKRQPERLWKRLRAYDRFHEVVLSIESHCSTGCRLPGAEG